MEEGAGGQIPGSLASQPRAHPTAPTQREEELRRAKAKKSPRRWPASWSGQSPRHCLPLPSSAGGAVEVSAPSKEIVLLW